jgi:opacity protein-like surface antigen
MYRNHSAHGLRALLLIGVSVVSLTAAQAADMYSGGLKDGPAYVPYNWTGFYAGTNSGGVVGTGQVADPFGPSIYGDDVTTPSYLFGGQIGYNRQMNNWVWGVEADADWADSDARNTCLAYSGDYISADCRVRTNALGTIAGRLGYAAGPEGRTLLFAKGGGAWTSQSVSVTNNALYAGGEVTNTTNFTAWGWMVGGGVEHALTPRWSVKAEYNYLDFGDTSIAYPASTSGFPTSPVAAGTTKISEQEHLFKVGVNYHVGAIGPDWGGSYASPFDLFGGAASYKDAAPVRPGWNFEFGTRYWASTGNFQWDVKQDNRSNISRLTYTGLDGNSGELFARVDTPYNIFVKGVAGLGAINSGKMNDEDWSIGGIAGNEANLYGAVPYTNTVSNEGNGTLGYATADVGFDFLRGADYRVGPFVGFSYYTQRTDTTGCVQIANADFYCLDPGDNTLVGTQTSAWTALRLGAAADYSLGYGFRLTTDAAWLANVSFKGRDNHLLRTATTYADQKFDNGQGVQVEAILNYDFSNRFSLGLGGRYWAMWGDGSQTMTSNDGYGTITTIPAYPNRISTDRYGLLVQGSYKLSGVDAPLPMPLK